MTKELKNHADILRQLNDKNVDVGWFENATYPTGQSVAAVMIANEFGTRTTPARPLMRQSAEIMDKKVPGFVARRTVEVLDGKLSAKEYLGKLGEALVSTVQTTLAAGQFEPNAESTEKKKGFNKPLVDTSLLGQSITHRES